jgi:hypothetical protein
MRAVLAPSFSANLEIATPGRILMLANNGAKELADFHRIPYYGTRM